MVRSYTLPELKSALQGCNDLVECLMVNRAVMLDKKNYSQKLITEFSRELDKRVGQLNKKSQA